MTEWGCITSLKFKITENLVPVPSGDRVLLKPRPPEKGGFFVPVLSG
jgi:hypothetical protein